MSRSQRLLATLFTSAALLALLVGFAGCGDDSDDPPRLEVDPGALTLAKGRSSTVMARVDGRTATSAVTWLAINPQVATVVEGDGGTAVITAVSAGETKVTVSQEGGTASLIVTVGEAEIDSIAITPAMPQVAAGTSADLIATATLSDRTTRNVTAQVTWSSSDTAKATVDAAGKLRGLVKGAATVTAKLGALTATTNATITDAVLTAIAVTPVNVTLPKGLKRQMTATGTFSDSSTQDLTMQVTWASSNAARATVSATGEVTGTGVGNAMISATMGSITGQVVVDITAAVLQSIAITPAAPSVAKGLTISLTATGTFSDATTQDLSTTAAWSSGDAAVATTAGRVVTGVNPGNATISAAQDGITGTVSLEVTPAVLLSIQVTPADTQLAKGRTRQMIATGLFSDGSNAPLTQTALWQSSNATLVSISNAAGSQGLATAENVGTATLSATMNGVTGTTTLEVTAAELVSIAVTPAAFSLALGRTQQLTAIGTFSDASTDDITAQASWSSSNNAIASVSATGLVTAAGPGNATITAAMNGITGTSAATITDATLVSIAVTSMGSGSLPVGVTRQFIATGTFSDSTTDIITDQVTWQSSDTAAVAISNAAGSHGLATALAPGDVTISATLDGVTETATLSAVAVTLVSIAVTPNPASLPAGTDLQLRADGTYNNGATLDITTQVTWTSSSDTTVTVSNVDGSRGLAHGVAAGAAVVTATQGAISGNAAVTVTPAVITSIAVAPANATIDLGNTQQFTATATFSDGSTQDVTATAAWTSSDAAVASVSVTGLATGLGGGTASIRATQAGVTGTASLFVKAIVSIAITPTGDLARGLTRQLAATATFNDTTTSDVTQLATWSSSNAAALTVTNTAGTKGQATALTTAGATVTATVGAISGNLVIGGCALLVNEVQTQGAGGASDEWVEIATSCTSDQSLVGLRLVYRSAAGTSDTPVLTLAGTIAAGGYQFYVNTAVAGSYTGESGTFGTGLAAAGGGLAIRVGANGGLVDSMGFGTATNAFVEGTVIGAPSATQSAARIPDKQDTNNNSVDFALRTTRTPGAANL